MEGNKSFEWEDVIFDDLDNGNIKCGVCQKETIRLISHMSGSPG